MGIKNFKKFLLSKTNEPIISTPFDKLKISSVCVDINIFIYKFITAIRRTDKDIIKDGKIVSHIIGLNHQINLFEKLNIVPIYVFDGNSPKEKNKILQQRKENNINAKKEYEKTKSTTSFQQSFYITNDIIKTTKEYLKSRNIKYIHSDYESDLICASLVKHKIVDCVYSTDFDMLAYGTPCMLTNIDYKAKTMDFIYLKNMLKQLNISYDDFLNIVILSGCDYCDKTENMTLNRAYKLVLESEIKLNKCGKNAKQIFNTIIPKRELKNLLL
jgi:flap endonuclease-1